MLAAAARHERLQRINCAAAYRKAVNAVNADEAQVQILEDKWAVRQLAINPLPKAPWFAIESERDAPEPERPSVETIQRVVSEHFGITRDDMISARRTGNLIIPRHMAMALCRELTLRSYPDIARRFGNRDHTVSMYATQKIEALRKSDPKIAFHLHAIKAKLGFA